MIFIKKLNNSTFDVFWNSGWNCWSRLQKGRKGFWRKINGEHLPNDVFKTFKEEVRNA